MNNPWTKITYIYLLLVILSLVLAGCLIDSMPTITSETETPNVAISTIDITPNPLITKQVLPTSTQNPPSTASPTTASRPSIYDGRIAYLFTGANSTKSLNGKAMIIDIQGNILTEIELDCLFCNSLSWSPNGQWLAYSAYKDLPGIPEIYMAKTDNSEIKRTTYTLVSKIDVTWSPDEKYLTYVEDTETADIINLALDNNTLHRLTSTSGIESNPAWSPDGKSIAFIYRTSRLAPGELWIMRSDGSSRQRVVDIPVAISQISWSPNGKQIAFSSPQKCGDIYAIDVESHKLSKLIDIAGCASNPAWSPNGESIAFIGIIYDPPNSATVKSWELNLMDINGNNIIPIRSGNESEPLFLTWNPVPTLQIGKTYSISALGTNLNLRESPSLTSNILEKLKEGNKIRILSGPVQEDGYYWWSVVTEQGAQGWVADVSGWFLLSE